MKTRNIGTTVISALLFIIAGCQVEQVVPNLREHTINAVIDDGETKVRLVQGNDSPNLLCRWDGDEYIYVYYKMIDKYNEESPQVQVKEVSTDGRSAKFTYSVPSSWDDHDTYEVKCFTSICHPTVVDDSIYVDASLKRESIDHFRDYIYAEGEIDKSSTLEAPFHHYYTYELLHVSNTSGSEIRFAEVGFEGKYWYKTQGSICIDDGRFVPLGPASQKPYEKSDEISIKPGEEGIIVSAYIPNGLKINDATLVSIIDDKSVKTSNKKSSDVNLEQGHAYHLYVEWDGKELRFANAPSEVKGFELSCDEVNFGKVPVGRSVTRSVTARNAGTSPVTFYAEAWESPIGYDWKPTESVTLGPGEATDIDITFAPLFAGDGSFNLEITGDQCRLARIKVSGEGIDPGSIGYVDLGLPSGLKWATCNIGASSPEDKGDFYAWGETSTKDEYTLQNYIYYSGDETYNVRNNDFNKYNSNDGLNILLREDDVAWLQYGSNWRTPTMDDWSELDKYCERVEEEINGVKCYKFTSKTNGHTLYLPFAGFYKDGEERTGLKYWSSNRHPNGGGLNGAHAYGQGIYYSYQSWDGEYRYEGLPVRAVYDDAYLQYNIQTSGLVDMGTSVKWAATNMGASSLDDVGDYYSWGETSPKEDYSLKNYSYYSGDETYNVRNNDFNKYNSNDGLNILLREDDVVYLTFGKNWRTPTYDEWMELENNCEIKTICYDGVRGELFTSKTTANALFFPYSGAYTENGHISSMSVKSWSSNRHSNSGGLNGAHAYGQGIYYSYQSWDGIYRYWGLPVRAVYDDAYLQYNIQTSGLVDMGTSVKWAATNMGASSLDDVGDYYSWGETASKEDYSLKNYSYYSGDDSYDVRNNDFNKYNSVDGLDILLREDDVVYLTLGKNWRTPTYDEWMELKNNCEIKTICYDGVRGELFTSKTTENTLFFPYSGAYTENGHINCMSVKSWSSNRHSNPGGLNGAHAYGQGIYYSYQSWDGIYRYWGLPVRGVYDDAYLQYNIQTSGLVDMGTSVKWAATNVGSSAIDEIGNFYAWGETQTKSEYTVQNYIFYSGDSSYKATSTDFSKYNKDDHLVVLEPEDDVAYRASGGRLRIPTYDEWMELVNKCEIKTISYDSVRGQLFTSKVTSNTMFLPFGGAYTDSQGSRMSAKYWSSNRHSNSGGLNGAHAYGQGIYYSYQSWNGIYRYWGLLVRGVEN